MAQVAFDPGLESLAGVGAQDSAIDRIAVEQVGNDAALQRRKSGGILRRAVKAWRAGDIARAGRLALEATAADETHGQAFHMLAMALERMGHLHKALVTYERAVELDPDDPDLLINLGLTAWNLKMIDAATDLFRRFIAVRPESPLGYNNLGTIQCEMGKSTLAIETLKSALYRMPQEAVLWNSLATVLAESGRADESVVFYEEAIRLAPDFARPWHNLGFAYSHLGRLDEALTAYDEALKLAVDPTEIMEGNHSRSVCLMGMGRLEEGFRDYELRHSPRFRSYVHHVLNAPRWNGEPLHGKTILVVGEQGIGDEFMFGNILPDLAEAVGAEGRLEIAVDPRMVALFARSFPQAQVGSYDDRKLIGPDVGGEIRLISWAGEPDFYAPMGTPLQFLRRRIEDFPYRPFIVPDAVRRNDFRRRLEAKYRGPFVGICWRSMMQDAKRQKYFSPLDSWGPILKTPGVTFVNVQYGDCRADLARAAALHGAEIVDFEDIDLKKDIDGAAALSAALDLVISAPTAAAATAGAVGTEVWFLTAGRTWPQLGTDHYPWYAKTRVLSPEKFGDWSALMPEIGARLALRSRDARAQAA